MSKASATYNQLPRKDRDKVEGFFIESLILCARREKDRLNRSHSKAIKEINDHIKELKRDLAEWEREQHNDKTRSNSPTK